MKYKISVQPVNASDVATGAFGKLTKLVLGAS